MGRFNNSKAAQVENKAKDTDMSTDVFDDDDFGIEADIVEPEVDEAEVSNEEPKAVETEPEPDITGYIELVDSFVERDEAGDAVGVSEDGIKQIRSAYSALSRKEKSMAKKSLNEKMENAVMEEDDITLARFYLEVINKMTETPKAPKGTGSVAKKADPTEALVRLIAKLDLARALVVIPDGVDEEDIRARAATLFDKGAEDVKTDDPELAWVRQAKNLASPKTAKVPSGTRRRHSVANHIAEAFENAEPGESLTVSQIVNFKSEEYGEDSPTKQAVLLHLQSKKFQAASSVSVAEDSDGETVLVKK